MMHALFGAGLFFLCLYPPKEQDITFSFEGENLEKDRQQEWFDGLKERIGIIALFIFFITSWLGIIVILRRKAGSP